MTDEELIAELERAFKEAEDEEVAATARKGKLARAIAVLGEIEVAPVHPATQALRDDIAAKHNRVAAKPKAAAAPPAKRTARVKDRRCEGCGGMFAAQGLGSHLKGCRGLRTRTPPLQSVPDAPEPVLVEPPSTNGAHFECSSCRFTFAELTELTRHIVVRHGRDPRPDERVAIPA